MQNNKLQRHHRLGLDRPERVYFTDEIISGTVCYGQPIRASVVLSGTVYLRKQHRNSFNGILSSRISIEISDER